MIKVACWYRLMARYSVLDEDVNNMCGVCEKCVCNSVCQTARRKKLRMQVKHDVLAMNHCRGHAKIESR